MRSFPLAVLGLLTGCTGIDFGDTCVFFEPGCSPPAEAALPDADTCYETCDEVDGYCPTGTCTHAWVDPCGAGGQDTAADCGSCGGDAWLCM